MDSIDVNRGVCAITCKLIDRKNVEPAGGAVRGSDRLRGVRYVQAIETLGEKSVGIGNRLDPGVSVAFVVGDSDRGRWSIRPNRDDEEIPRRHSARKRGRKCGMSCAGLVVVVFLLNVSSKGHGLTPRFYLRSRRAIISRPQT